MILRLYDVELPRALGKIFSMVMPQFLDAFVLFASLMQRYEFFPKPPNFFPIILLFFRWLAGQPVGQVTHLPTYPPMTGIFPKNIDYKGLLLYIL